MPSLNTKLASAPNTSDTYILKASGTTIGNSIMYQDSGGGMNVAYSGTTGGARIRITPDTPQGYIESYNSSGGFYKLVLATGGLSVRNGLSTVMMEVTSGGNVGIGTSSPSTYSHGGTNVGLEVSNSATSSNAQAHVILSTGAAANTGSIGTISWAVPNTAGNKLASLIASNLESNSATNPYANLTFYTSNGGGPTERMRITSGGDLYVGNTSFTSPSGADRFIGVYGGQDCSLILQDAVQTWEMYVNDDFYINRGSTSALTILRSNGYIGMGITNPQQALDIKAVSGATYVGTTVGSVDFLHGVDAAGLPRLFTSGSNAISIWTNSTERMRIKPDGTVGINTSAPNASLHISGGLGGFNRLTQMNVLNANEEAKNIISSKNSGGSDQWWSWGVTTANAFYIVGDASGSGGTGVKVNYGATSWSAGSDIRFKDIIEPITDATQKLNSLSTIIYKFKNDNENMRRVGLIAQELNQVFPEIVDVPDNENEMWSVRYTELIPVLVKAIQEQQLQINSLINT
jgi:hypothetical protein